MNCDFEEVREASRAERGKDLELYGNDIFIHIPKAFHVRP